MATQDSLDLAQTLYIAYYGRPADAEGQAFWAEQIDEQGVEAVVNDFGTSEEFDSRFGDFSNEELVTNLYQQLFDREPDEGGLAFYTDKLDSGELSLADIALTVVQNASGDDVDTLANKQSVAQSFTDAMADTPEAYSGKDANEAGRDFIAQVGNDTDPDEVDAEAEVQALVNLESHGSRLPAPELAQTLYVAYYGRPADPDGQTFWADKIEADGIDSVLEDFGASDEFDERFGNMNDEQLVSNLYQQLFSRTPENGGLEFYVDKLEAGELSLAEIALTIAENASGDDATALGNKVELAQAFTDALDAAGDTEIYSGNDANSAMRNVLLDIDADTDVDAIDVEGLIQQLANDATPGANDNIFTLTEVTTSEQIDELKQSVEPTVDTVIYWGDAASGEGVPAEEVFGKGALADSMGDVVTDLTADGLTELLDQVRAITDAGVADMLQGEGAIGDIGDNDNVEVVDGDSNSITVNDDGTVVVEQTEDAKNGDYTGDYQIVLNVEGADVANGQIELTAEQFQSLGALLFDGEGNSRLFEVEQKSWPQVAFNTDGTPFFGDPGDSDDVIRDAAGEVVEFDLKEYVTQEGETVTTEVPLVLTPTTSNGGVVEGEGKLTTGQSDLIVAVRLDLLHQAYIDGGAGYDTLEVDAKGYFAQPLGLRNIEQVNVQNLPNIYGKDYPEFDGTGETASILDLSRATELEALVVTEGGYNDLEGSDNVDDGPITLTGIRNGAETTLDGNFTQDVTLNYGELQGDGVALVFNNLAFNADLNVAHNSDTLNIRATGGSNYLGNASLGGQLTTLAIAGGASLFIDDDLEASFRDGTPATIDASENSGGVTLALTDDATGGLDEITFHGSQAGDRVTLEADERITLEGNGGDNVYDVTADTVAVSVMDGNNELALDASDVSVTAGDGNNVIDVASAGFFGGADSVVITTGDGDNTITANNADDVTITTGDGDDVITAVRGESVTIESTGGDNEITVSADEMAITTGAGDDTIIVSGMLEDAEIGGDANTTALLNIATGEGEDTVVLGRDVFGDNPDFQFGITALEGSSISGSNISLYVENPSDLRAAELDGIGSVVFNYDIIGGNDTDNGNGNGNAGLTLTDQQFADIGAENFSVEGAMFDNAAQLKLIVTESTSLTDLGVDDLPAGIDLQLELRDGVTLEMTAQQLHEKVAEEGVTVADDGNDDRAPGEVYITDAGNGFDAYDNTVDGSATTGGTLDDDVSFKIENGGDDYERPSQEPTQLSRWLHDSDEDGAEIVADASTADLLRLEGESDLTMVPVEGGIDDWGNVTDEASAIEMNAENAGATDAEDRQFYVDFSALEGQLNDLTLARFEDVAAVYGNGNDARLNVELSGNLGDDGTGEGLVSRNVQTYVVTDLDGDDRQFWTCETTQDLETLGLRGNYGDAITFGNTERGVDFRMEVVNDKQNGYSVGGVVANFARGQGATAAIEVVGLDDLPTGEVQTVESIETNASAATVSVTGGDTVIEALTGSDLETLELSADGGLAIEGDLPTTLSSIDASGVEGVLTASIDGNPTGDADDYLEGGFDFVGAAGGSVLTLDDLPAIDDGDVAAYNIDGGDAGVQLIIDGGETGVNLTESTLTNVTGVELTDDARLTLTMAQADEIGAGNVLLEDGASGATLNLEGLNDEPFSRADYPADVTVTLTLANEPTVTLHEDTDLTDIGSLEVPDGTTLELTAEQFQQLDGIGTLTGEGSVHITGMTQADVGENGEDLDLSNVDVDGSVEVSLAEDVNLTESTLMESGEPIVDTFDLDDDLTLTLAAIANADGVDVIGGDDSVLAFTDTETYNTTELSGTAQDYITARDNYLADPDNTANAMISAYEALDLGLPDLEASGTIADQAAEAADYLDEVLAAALDGIDASGFDIGTLKALNVLVDDQNLERLFADLDSDVTLEVYNDLGFLQPVYRTVVVNEGTTVSGFLAFNDIEDASELRTLDLDLMGGTEVTGDINLATKEERDSTLIPQHFDTLTINSEGSAENLLNGETANVITGDITADADTTDGTDENNLKNVVINASQDFVLEGTLVFNSVTDNDDVAANDDDQAEVTLAVTGDADVTLKAIDTTDDDIANLVIDHTGTGTLTITGGSDALELDDTEGLTFTGSGDIVLDTNDDDADNNGIEGNDLESIDASEHSGDLTLGVVEDIDSENFSFTAGSGVNTMTLAGTTLDAAGDDDAAGWSFDFSNAAEGSELRLDGNNFDEGPLDIDMGDNGTLYIDDDTDLTNVDFSFNGDQDIVVADGAKLTLTAAQASGLNIVGENGADSPGKVTITELGEDPVDFSDISGDLKTEATLVNDVVELDETTNLGDIGIRLDDDQVIGFATEEQADGRVVKTEQDVDDDDNGSIAWLFDEIADKPLDASGYADAIERLFINDGLVVNDPEVESLWEDLSPSIETINIQYDGSLEDFLDAIPIQRTFEVQAFADLSSGLDLLDDDEARFLENVTLELGGEVAIDSLTLDEFIGPDTEGDTSFGTLTINSQVFENEDDPLAPKNWEDGENLERPNAVNEIGAIESGDDLDLTTVVLDAQEVSVDDDNVTVDLDIASIAFSGSGNDAAELAVNGAGTTTIERLDLTDASLTSDSDEVVFNIAGTSGDPESFDKDTVGTGNLVVTEEIAIDAAEAGSSAVINTNLDNDATVKAVNLGANVDTLTVNNDGAEELDITGGSPAISGENLETLDLVAGDGDLVVGGPEDGSDDVWGIDAANLSELNAGLGLESSGSGSVEVHLSNIGDTFTYNDTGSDEKLNQVWLQGDELADGGDWTFNLTPEFDDAQSNDAQNAGTSTLGLTGGTTFSGGSLTVNAGFDGGILVDGDVDLRDLDELTIQGGIDEEGENAVDVFLESGAELRMTDQQFFGGEGEAFDLEFDGDGTTYTAEDGEDLTEVRGLSEIRIPEGASVTLTADQAAFAKVVGEDEEGEETVSGAGELGDADVTVVLSPYDNANSLADSVSGVSHLVVNGTQEDIDYLNGFDGELTIDLTAAQVDDLESYTNQTEGDVTVTVDVTELGDTDVDLSVIPEADAGTVTLSDDVELDAATDLGDFAVDVNDKTLTLTADQANGRVIGGTGTGSIIVTALAETPDADLSDVSVDTTLQLADEDDLAFTGELNANSDVTVTVDGDDSPEATLDITGATVADYDADDANAEFSVESGATLVLTDEQADARPITGQGDATVEMDGDSGADLSEISANLSLALGTDVDFDGSFFATETVDVSGEHQLDITAVAAADLPTGFTLASGSSLRVTAEQADDLTDGIDGEGEAVITALDEALSADLSRVSVDTTLELAEDDDLAFDGDLNANANLTVAAAAGEATLDITDANLDTYDADDASAEFTVNEGATLVLTDEQADARPIDGEGDVSVEMDGGNATDLSNVTANLTLALSGAVDFTGAFAGGETVNISGEHDFDITALALDELPDAFDLDGTDLIVTAEQADALTVTGASSVTVQDLDETADADLTGIEVPLILDLEGNNVDFEGPIDTADLSVLANGEGSGTATLDITNAAAFSAEAISVEADATLVMDGSQLGDVDTDGFSVKAGGTVDLRGDVQAADVLDAGLDEVSGEVEIGDATSLEGSAADVLDVTDAAEALSDSDIDITVNPAASVAQAEELAAIETSGDIDYSVQDGLTEVLEAATGDNSSSESRSGLDGAEPITIDDLDNDEKVVFGGLSDNNEATSIDFTGDDAATLSVAEFVEISGDGTDEFDLDFDSSDTITVNGADSEDTIDASGQAADITFVGREGDDTLTAGDGDDTFIFGETAAENGNDTITDFGDNGTDVIDFATVASGGAGITAGDFQDAAVDGNDGDVSAVGGFAMVSDGSGSARTADSLGTTDVADFLADVDGSGNGFAFSETDNALYLAVTDGEDLGIYLADSQNDDLVIDDSELEQIATLNGVTSISESDLVDFTVA